MQLPAIQYRQRQALPQQDPGIALSRAKQDIALGNAVTKLANTAADISDKYKWTSSAMGVTGDLSSFRNEYAGKKFYTADDVRDLGLEDVETTREGVFDDEGNAVERDFIPAYEVYPKALQNKYNETIGTWSQGLRPGAKRDFEQQMHSQATRELEREVSSSTAIMQKNDIETRLLDIADAKSQGNWVGAFLGINDLPVSKPEKRELMKGAMVEKETERDRDLVTMGDLDEIRERSSFLRSPKYKGDYDNNEREQTAKYLDGSANALVKLQEAQVKAARQAALRQVWDRLPGEMDPGLVEPWMDPTERTAIVNYISKNGKIETDQAVWYRLERMAGRQETQQEFINTNLYRYRDKLSMQDFQGLAKKQADLDNASSSGSAMSSLRSYEAQFDDGLRVIDINPNAKPGSDDIKIAETMRRAVMGRIHDKEAELDRKLNTTERQEIIDSALTTYLTDKKERAFWVGPKRRVPFDITDVPADKLPQVIEAINQMELPLTPEVIYRVYNQGKDISEGAE